MQSTWTIVACVVAVCIVVYAIAVSETPIIARRTEREIEDAFPMYEPPSASIRTRADTAESTHSETPGYLGTFGTVDACVVECLKSDPSCKGVQYHSPNYPKREWAGTCYALGPKAAPEPVMMSDDPADPFHFAVQGVVM